MASKKEFLEKYSKWGSVHTIESAIGLIRLYAEHKGNTKNLETNLEILSTLPWLLIADRFNSAMDELMIEFNITLLINKNNQLIKIF